jgi:hypothetical protein
LLRLSLGDSGGVPGLSFVLVALCEKIGELAAMIVPGVQNRTGNVLAFDSQLYVSQYAYHSHSVTCQGSQELLIAHVSGFHAFLSINLYM